MTSSAKVSATLKPTKQHLPLFIATVETGLSIIFYFVVVLAVFPHLGGSLTMFIPSKYGFDYHGVINSTNFSVTSLIYISIMAAAWIVTLVLSRLHKANRALISASIVHLVSAVYAAFFVPNVLADITAGWLWGVGVAIVLVLYAGATSYVILRGLDFRKK